MMTLAARLSRGVDVASEKAQRWQQSLLSSAINPAARAKEVRQIQSGASISAANAKEV